MKINDKISESRSNKKLCNSNIESNKKNRKIIILVKQNSKEKEHEIMFSQKIVVFPIYNFQTGFGETIFNVKLMRRCLPFTTR